jgi:hypothetical protein
MMGRSSHPTREVCKQLKVIDKFDARRSRSPTGSPRPYACKHDCRSWRSAVLFAPFALLRFRIELLPSCPRALPPASNASKLGASLAK